MKKAKHAVIVSLNEWQIHIASFPKMSGKIMINSGGAMMLRSNEIVNAFFVSFVDCSRKSSRC